MKIIPLRNVSQAEQAFYDALSGADVEKNEKIVVESGDLGFYCLFAKKYKRSIYKD